MSYKAILFDLDGTLLDTLDDLHNSVNRTMSAFHFPPRTKEETRLAVGDGVGMLISRSIPGGQDNPKFAECLALHVKLRGIALDAGSVQTKLGHVDIDDAKRFRRAPAASGEVRHVKRL